MVIEFAFFISLRICYTIFPTISARNYIKQWLFRQPERPSFASGNAQFRLNSMEEFPLPLCNLGNLKMAFDQRTASQLHGFPFHICVRIGEINVYTSYLPLRWRVCSYTMGLYFNQLLSAVNLVFMSSCVVCFGNKTNM